MTEVQALLARLEVDRLETELGCPAGTLDGLLGVEASELTHLRKALSAGLATGHDEAFRAFASASALLPAGLAARVTRRIIGPTLTGRIAAVTPESRAAAITGALDIGFLADTCRTLAPPVAARMVPVIPRATVVDVCAELVRRRDYLTLGRLIGAVDDLTLRSVLGTLVEPRDLLLAGAATDDGAVLDRVIALLTHDRRATVIASAPAYPDEALSILVRVSADSRALLATAVAECGAAQATAIVDAITSLAATHPGVRAWAVSLPADELAEVSPSYDSPASLQAAVGRLAQTLHGADTPTTGPSS
ncbi:MAG: hypothetical protein ACI970_000345 [Myxococcota bacterium]|jgi:hypothetical protein